MKHTVIYKTYLNKRNKKTGQFFKRIVIVCGESENAYLTLASLRKVNKDNNTRYSIGHVKDEDLNKEWLSIELIKK